MQNPEESASNSMNLTAQTMFNYDTHRNIPWNFLEYSPERQYLDPAEQVLQRKYSTQKKGQKDTKYKTKRGFYMDYDLKVAKSVPGSNVYHMNDSWDGSDDIKKSKNKKIDPKLMKYTYIERIEMEQKNRKVPGVSTYRLQKTMDQLKEEQKKRSQKKVKNGEKRYFYEDTEFLSNLAPGAGAHNPHQIKDKLHMNKTDPKFWVSKHTKEQEAYVKRKSKEPCAVTYKPLPNVYTTFTRWSEIPKEKLQKKNGFGTDEKFAYLRQAKVKSKIKEVRPSPDTYNTYIEWPTKFYKTGQGANHKKNWHNRISHGHSPGVYH